MKINYINRDGSYIFWQEDPEDNYTVYTEEDFEAIENWCSNFGILLNEHFDFDDVDDD